MTNLLAKIKRMTKKARDAKEKQKPEVGVHPQTEEEKRRTFLRKKYGINQEE